MVMIVSVSIRYLSNIIVLVVYWGFFFCQPGCDMPGYWGILATHLALVFWHRPLRDDVSHSPGHKMSLPGEQMWQGQLGSSNQQQKLSPEEQLAQQPSTGNGSPPFPSQSIE